MWSAKVLQQLYSKYKMFIFDLTQKYDKTHCNETMTYILPQSLDVGTTFTNNSSSILQSRTTKTNIHNYTDWTS